MIAINRILKNLSAVFLEIFLLNLAVWLLQLFWRGIWDQRITVSILCNSRCFYFYGFSDFGLNDLIIRDVARNHNLAPQYFISSLISKTILSCLSIIFLILYVYLMGYSEEIILYTIVFSASILFIVLMNSITSIFKAFEQMGYVLLISIISSQCC